LQSFDVPGAIHRVLDVRKPYLLALWRPGQDEMPLFAETGGLADRGGRCAAPTQWRRAQLFLLE